MTAPAARMNMTGSPFVSSFGSNMVNLTSSVSSKPIKLTVAVEGTQDFLVGSGLVPLLQVKHFPFSLKMELD